MINVSIVIPVYSGEKYLKDLFQQILDLKVRWAGGRKILHLSEAIFVVDDAKDNSEQILRHMAQENDMLKIVTLSRNYGQHASTIAGISASTGDWVVTLDEDLQHPPAYIEEMLGVAAENSSDVVYINPLNNVHSSFFRDKSSRIYKRVIEYLTGNNHIRKANSFRLIRGDIARSTAAACGYNTYLDVALGWFTDRFVTLDKPLEDQRYIKTGSSGYNLKSLLSHASRLAFSSHIKILRLATFIGVFSLVLTFIAIVALIIMKIFFPDVVIARGWTSLMLVNFAIGGMILFLLGIILEYISLLVFKAHGRPLYSVIDRSSDKLLKDYFQKKPSR